MKETLVQEFNCKYLKKIDIGINEKIPLKLYPIAAGKSFNFENSPLAEIDLKDYLFKNPESTTLFEVVSDSLEPEIRINDRLIIERKLAYNLSNEQLDGKIVAVIFEGESLVKRFMFKNGQIYLTSDNPEYKPIKVNEFQYYQIWGIVTFLIRDSNKFINNQGTFLSKNEVKNILKNKSISSDEKILLIQGLL